MADGSIVIDTQLDNEGFKKGSEKLLNAIKKLTATAETLQQSLQSGFSSEKQFESFRQKVVKFENDLKNVKEDLEAFGNTGIKNSTLEKLIEESKALVPELEKIKRLKDMIDAYERGSSKAFPTLEELAPYGGTAAGVRKAYQEIFNQWKEIEDKISELEESGAKVFQMGSETEEYARMTQSLNAATEAQERLNEAASEEHSFGPDENQINKWQKFAQAIYKAGKAALTTTANLAKMGFEKIANGISSVVRRLKNFVTQGNSADSLVKRLTSSFFGLKRMLLTRLKSSFISSIISSAKSALSELANYSNSFGNVLNNLKAAANGLAGNLAVSFGGLLTAIEPILTKLINMISTAITYINAIFGLLTGKTVITVAKGYASGMNDAAGATGAAAKAQKELNRQLYSFDELNKRNETSDSGSGGSGGGGGAGGGNALFDTMSIDSILPDSIKDFIQKIKNAIANGDWEGVGGLLATGLNSIVAKIDKWNTNVFQPKAVEWASNIARTINGFFRDWDAEATGSMLGGMFNTVIETAYRFITTLDWETMGTRIAGLFNGLFDRVDWNQLGTTIGSAISGFWTMISNWANDVHWEEHGKKIAEGFKSLLDTKPLSTKAEALKNLFNGLVKWLGSFVENFPWQKLKDELSAALSKVLDIDIGDLILNLGNLIINFAHSLAQAVTENKSKFAEFGRKVGNALAQLNWLQFIKDVATIIVDGLGSAIKGLLESDSGGLILAIAGGLAAIKIAKTAFSAFGGKIAAGIIEAITTSISGLTAGAGSVIASALGVAALGALAGAAIYNIVLRYTTEGADEAKAELSEITTKLSLLKSDTDSGKYAIDGKKLIADELLSRYQELATKTDLTGKEEEELRSITGQLVDIFPELSGLVNDETGYFKEDATQIANTVTELTRLYKIRGLEEAMTKAWEAYGDAVYYSTKEESKLKDMMELRQAIQDGDMETINKHKGLLDECGISYDELSVAIRTAGADWDELNAMQYVVDSDMEKLDGTIAEQEAAVAGLNSKTDEAKDVVDALTIELGYLNDGFNITNGTISGTFDSYDKLKEALSYLCSEGALTEKQYSALLAQIEESETSGLTAEEALSGIESALGDLGITVEDVSGDVGEAMGDIVESTSDTADDVLKEVEDAKKDAEKVAAETVGGFTDRIRAGKPKVEKAAKEVAEATEEGLDSKTDSIKTIGSTMGSNMKSGITSMIEKVKAQANKTSQDAYDAFGSKTTQTTQTGSTYGDNLRKGIVSQLETITAAANTTAKNVFDAFNNHVDNMTTVGTKYGGNLYSGLLSKSVNLTTLANTIAKNIYNGLNSQSSTYTIGYNLGLGLYNGLNALSSSVISTAKNLATNVVNTVKNTFGINSPSKVFEEIGENDDKGFINGIDNLRGKVLTTASNLASDVVDASDIGTDNEFTMSTETLTDGLDRITSKLSSIAQIFVTIGSALDSVGGLFVPDIVNGSAIPMRATIGSVASVNGNSDGISAEMTNSLETQNNLLREQNSLLQQLINVSGNGNVVDVSTIMNGFSRINRRTGKSVIQIG